MNSRRRTLVTFAAVGLPSWLQHAVAQRLPRVGVLFNGSERSSHLRLDALRAGLKALGYVEGKNLILTVLWNESGMVERLPDLAANLLRERPDVIVAAPAVAAAAVRKHTDTVPIVMGWGAGAVKIGLAKSLARPGGNVTGLDAQNEELVAKHVELLKEIAPNVARLGVLNTGKSLFHDEAWASAVKAAQILKLVLVDLRVNDPRDFARVASACGNGSCEALYVMSDPVLVNWRAEIIELAARLRIPAIYTQPDFALEGGLLSYSPNIDAMALRAATFVDKILKGAKPADLPIERPTRFELIVNQKTAKALGLTIPQTILVRADRMIQ